MIENSLLQFIMKFAVGGRQGCAKDVAFILNSFFPEAPAYLIDLMHDKNAEIRKVCDNTLDIIAVGLIFLICPSRTSLHDIILK